MRRILTHVHPRSSRSRAVSHCRRSPRPRRLSLELLVRQDDDDRRCQQLHRGEPASVSLPGGAATRRSIAVVARRSAATGGQLSDPGRRRCGAATDAAAIGHASRAARGAQLGHGLLCLHRHRMGVARVDHGQGRRRAWRGRGWVPPRRLRWCIPRARRVLRSDLQRAAARLRPRRNHRELVIPEAIGARRGPLLPRVRQWLRNAWFGRTAL